MFDLASRRASWETRLRASAALGGFSAGGRYFVLVEGATAGSVRVRVHRSSDHALVFERLVELDEASVLALHASATDRVAASDDGRWLAVATARALQLFATGDAAAPATAPALASPTRVRFDATGTRLAVTRALGTGHEVVVLALSAGRWSEVATLPDSTEATWTADGLLLLRSADIAAWRSGRTQRLYPFPAGSRPVAEQGPWPCAPVCFDPNGRFAALELGGLVLVADLASGRALFERRHGGDGVHLLDAALAADRARLFVADATFEGTLVTLGLPSGRVEGEKSFGRIGEYKRSLWSFSQEQPWRSYYLPYLSPRGRYLGIARPGKGYEIHALD
jgi:hypothetical protein